MAARAEHGRVQILPMETAGTHHLIDRAYRESGKHQWVRETYTNAAEAGATRIEFGIEWQAVESLGVYRRVIADNGKGMTADELVAFFNTFGGGGKPIGGVHENFGVGAKTSLLPWNQHGVVVVSWVDGEASMIWVQRDASSEEYGLRLIEAEDADTGELSLEGVYEPFDDRNSGCDWSRIKPHWIKENGTVIVLLGNSPEEDTVLGDRSRGEADIKGLSTYLNRRIWMLPPNVEVYVDELRTTERSKWPATEAVAHGPVPKDGADRRTNMRKVEGARFYIEYPVAGFQGGGLEASGSVELRDGCTVDWYLWQGDRPAVQSYAAVGGYIAAMYKNELYDVTVHPATYRSFGITEAVVKKNLWLIVRPPLLRQGGHGVYPRTDRNALLLQGGPDAGTPLPMTDWGTEFADCMPQQIIDAIGNARSGEDGSLDEVWRERLADRFGSRWRIPKLRAMAGGTESMEAQQDGTHPRRIKARKRRHTHTGGGGGGTTGRPTIGIEGGNEPAKRTNVGGGIPSFRTVREDSIESGMLAAWSPNEPGYPQGAVLINVDHPVLRAEVEYWQAQFADHLADDIRKDVINAYGEIAVSKIAHSEHLRGQVPSKVIDEKFRSNEALTMSLLGLLAEEAVIAPRIGGKYKGVRRRREESIASN